LLREESISAIRRFDLRIEIPSRLMSSPRPVNGYTIVSLIGNTTTHGGLVVRAQLDRRKYPTGRKVSAKEIRELKIERDAFHGDWNYVIHPRKEMR